MLLFSILWKFCRDYSNPLLSKFPYYVFLRVCRDPSERVIFFLLNFIYLYLKWQNLAQQRLVGLTKIFSQIQYNTFGMYLFSFSHIPNLYKKKKNEIFSFVVFSDWNYNMPNSPLKINRNIK